MLMEEGLQEGLGRCGEEGCLVDMSSTDRGSVCQLFCLEVLQVSGKWQSFCHHLQAVACLPSGDIFIAVIAQRPQELFRSTAMAFFKGMTPIIRRSCDVCGHSRNMFVAEGPGGEVPCNHKDQGCVLDNLPSELRLTMWMCVTGASR